MGWLLHVTGIDTQSSPYYDFWSGIGPVLFTQGSILLVYYRHHNCQEKWCWRLGHPDPATNQPVCNKHHPKHKGGDTK